MPLYLLLLLFSFFILIIFFFLLWHSSGFKRMRFAYVGHTSSFNRIPLSSHSSLLSSNKTKKSDPDTRCIRVALCYIPLCVFMRFA